MSKEYRKTLANIGDWTLMSDPNQYLLINNSKKVTWYYANLESALRDILDAKIKDFADNRKTLEALLDAVKKAELTVETVIEQLSHR